MKIGLVGAGLAGRTHGGAINRIEGSCLSAVFDINEAAATTLAGGKCPVFTDLESFFHEGDFDAVDICLPTFLHEDVVVRALKAGKHVLCEKPLVLSVQAAQRISAVLAEGDRTLMAAHVIRFWPQYVKIRELIQSGAIGRVEIASLYRLSELPRWNRWAPDPEKSGGALYDFHIHDLDFAYSLWGIPQSLSASGIRSDKGAWDSLCSTLSCRIKPSRSKARALPGRHAFPLWDTLVCGIGGRGRSFVLVRAGKRGFWSVPFSRWQKHRRAATLKRHFRMITRLVPSLPVEKSRYEEEIRYFIAARKRAYVQEGHIRCQVIDVLQILEQEKTALEKRTIAR
jgi:hypothetical protein